MKALTVSLLTGSALGLCLTCNVLAADTDSAAGVSASLPDNEAQAKARAALYADMPVESAPEPTATPAEPAAETAPKPEPQAEPAPAEEPMASTAPRSLPDNEAQAAARAALANAYPQPAPVAQPTPVATPAAAAATAAVAATTSAPPLPTSATQDQQLDLLLQQYRADAISASEYHSRRAEILAEK